MIYMSTEAPAKGSDIPEFPVFKDRKEMDGYLRELGYGRLNEFGKTVNDREKLVDLLRKRNPKLNGQVDNLIEHLKLNKQEIERKEAWYTKVLKFPGRLLKGAWNTVKNHPYLTVGAVIAILLATGATTGYISTFLEQLFHKVGEGKTVGLGEAAKVFPIEAAGADMTGTGAYLP